MAPAAGQPLTNGSWTIDRIDGETVRLTGPDGATADFGMTFRVFLATSDPKPAKTQVSGVDYNGGTSWVASVPDPDSGIGGGDNPDWGDGFDPDIVTNPGSRTANLFNAAASKEIRPTGDTVEADGIRYQFAADPTFAFSTRIAFDAETGVPTITTTLESTGTAWFSVAYLGAPASSFADTEQVWQPLVWQGRRFPSTSYLTASYHCPVPSTLVTKAGSTVGVVAHPAEFPFMPLPVFENSRFGVAVRNAAGEAQPILAAPILGGTGSRLTAGQSFTFRMCPFVATGDTTIAFERIARDLYDFRDVRHNQIGSMNTALDNMLAYGMSDYSQFLEEEKGCSYATDAPGAVKNVSSLSPLDMALTTDDETIWKRRAYPYIEYMLSRKKFLFTTDESQNIQNPSYTLEGPVAPISELVALNRISNGAASEMLELAEAEYESSRVRNLNVAEPGDTWQNSLQLYRATGDASYLQTAIEGADAYIARRITDLPEDFNDPDAALYFWTGYAPRFIDLLLLYEATGEQRFLDASWKAARFFAMHCWFAPRIPDENVTVNQGNQAPVYYYLEKRTVGPISIPEETVPAWRVSAQGLTCESSGTSTGHRAIFMANYAPWFLRLAWLKDDDFLRDIARSAIVGRWMNFPGYHMNTARTTVYEKPDYPLRPFNQLSYNSFHFNHIWPLMSVALDYLVTDAETRSDGAISFEREFIEGYAYLQSSYYGMRPGEFHGEQPVRLWMPKGLAEVSSNELNYIAARGEDTLCLAFTNQNFSEEAATVTLDTELVPALSGRTRTARVWIDNQPAAAVQVSDGRFSLTVPAKGIAAVIIDTTEVVPVFQEGFADLSESDAWVEGHLEWTDPAARAMILNFGSRYRSFYFYLKDSKRAFSPLRLRYEIDGRYGEAADADFPWEFTVPLGSGDESVLFELEATRPDGVVEAFGPSVLVKDASGGFRLGDSTATRRVIPGSTAARVPGQRLLADRGAAASRRVVMKAPDGRLLDHADGTPALGESARTWLLDEVAPGQFTLRDGVGGHYLALSSTDGVEPLREVFASFDQRIESTSPSSPIAAHWSLRVGPLGGSEAVRSLLNFDLTGLPTNPDSVELRLVRGANAAGDPADLDQDFAVYQLARGFVNGQATWLSAGTGVPWTPPGGDVAGDALVSIPYNPSAAGEGQALVFPDQPAFRSAVESAIAAGTPFNLLIRSNREDNLQRSEAYLASSEQEATIAPRLVLDYRTAFAAGAEVVLDAAGADRFALKPVSEGGQALMHLESGIHLLPGADGIVLARDIGADAGWTLTPPLSSRIILGSEGAMLSGSGVDRMVGVAPAGTTGNALRWEVFETPDGTIRVVHAASGQFLTLVEEASEWIQVPIVEDIRIRSSDEAQAIDADLAAGSINATTSFRSLMRFDLSGLPPGFTPTDAELALDVRIRDATSEGAAHTLQLFKLTQPYRFTGATWTTAGPGPWNQPGGTHDPAVLGTAAANPANVNPGQDLVFPGNAAFVSAVQGALAGELDLLLRSDRENTGRSFFWLASKEDDGVNGLEGPRLRVRGTAGHRLVLRPPGTEGAQAFRWVDAGEAGTLLQETASGRFLTTTGGSLETTLDPAAATAIQITEPESGSSLDGSQLDTTYLWTWFGAVDPSSHPWHFHTELGWVYVGWQGTDSLWGWMDGMGWIYTSELAYPLCFSEQRKEWMLVEHLPDEGEVCFTGLSSHTEHRRPSAAGFDVSAWLEMGAIPPPPTSPPQGPADFPPDTEPVLARSTRLLKGPDPDAWRLVTYGNPEEALVLRESSDLNTWSWVDELHPIDRGPIIFQLTRATDAAFWRTGP
ncbi:hypothetical protein [Haloferula sp. A504]|uniref:hypothetical protein n=1 Tax=Haloferula sp. A504 TaxID=3373601 RepID=UPI0031C4FAEE|nr:hypothetical protein [Verrucomicrobiaceae bacterium E54]